MPKVLVVFASRTGQTRDIGELIAEGLGLAGITAVVKDSGAVENEIELNAYEAVICGSATYHGEMLPAMKEFLFIAEKAELEGKVGGSFGAYGWSGEALDRIYLTMKHIFKMDMLPTPLRLPSKSVDGGVRMARDYGLMIAKRLKRASA